jgi:2-polyprenyl-3-methyl-5-hydroxy-6-metoxy-1,4-benzoquinol methylase
MRLAQEAGWTVEGIELNPRTAAQAASYTRAPVYRINAHQLALDGRRYDAVVLTDVLEHVPAPLRLLTTLAALLEPGGVIAVKVPNGHAQWIKERALARVTSHRISLAENLVHVNQFSPASLQLALTRAGFERIRLCTGAPELPPVDGALSRAALGRLLRLGVFAAASLPGALHTPLALNLQAYATRLRS